ncbi:MAG: galactose-1-phosphate uridylyltransferase [Eggerthellaceae bacterium]
MLELTINLTKPEKDPRAIAAAAADANAAPRPACREATGARGASEPQDAFAPLPDPGAVRVPQCDLCWENEGYAGSAEHPAKPGLRIAAIQLGGERWGLQYSPYAYFAEHCIALSEEHRPMRIDAACFERLLDFVVAFPFYFIGSNADLPIVGGSILSHDHFQGDGTRSTLMKAPRTRVLFPGGGGCAAARVRWPASTVRLVSGDRRALVRAASGICRFGGLRERGMRHRAFSAGEPHNTLNPIVHREARITSCIWCCATIAWTPGTLGDIPSRRIAAPHQEGEHRPHRDHGLDPAAAPGTGAARGGGAGGAACCGRSAEELQERLLAQGPTAPRRMGGRRLPGGRRSLRERNAADHDDLHPVIRQEVGRAFGSILEATGVFKRTAAGRAGWDSFIEELGRLPA